MDQFKSWALSGAALVSGMACVAGLWSLVPRESPEITENKVRFNELSSQEQADLRNKATYFVDPAKESELARLQQIHVAVKNDPALMPRLESLDTLLANLDPETEARLIPNGQFSEDWADQVRELASDQNACGQCFEFSSSALVRYGSREPGVVVSGSDYEAFLDQVAEGNWGGNAEYLSFIQNDDVTMRRMFKTLALVDRSIANETPELNAAILKAARETLIPPGTEPNDEIRKAMLSVAEFISSLPAEHQGVAVNLSALRILESGLRNTKRAFLTRYLARETVAPEVFTKNFKRSEQVELMSMAPEDAAQELKARLVSDNSVEDPHIARVNEILAVSRDRASVRSRKLVGELMKLQGYGNRSFFGGDRGGRRGRDDDGRGDRGPGGRSSGGRGADGSRDESGGRPDFDRRRVGGQPGDGRGPNGGGPGRPTRQPPAKRGSIEPAGLDGLAPDSELATQPPSSSVDSPTDESGS